MGKLLYTSIILPNKKRKQNRFLYFLPASEMRLKVNCTFNKIVSHNKFSLVDVITKKYLSCDFIRDEANKETLNGSEEEPT